MEPSPHYFGDFCPIETMLMKIDEMYVSVLPHLLPDTNPRLSDDQKRRDYDNQKIGPPSVLLMDFLRGNRDVRQLCEKVRKIKNIKIRRETVVRLFPHAIIPVKVWCRDSSLSSERFVKTYNHLIALEFPIVCEISRIVKILKSKPWVLYITLSADGACIIALVPLDNDDYRRHGLFFDALRSEFESHGLTVIEKCGNLTAMMAQTYDSDAWFNGSCVLFNLPRNFTGYGKEG